MKRVSLFAALAGVLTLTAWLGTARPAQAVPSCDELNNSSCTSGTTSCRWSGGGFGFCSCYFGNWICS